MQDRFGNEYYSKSPEDNPQGPETGGDRVRRSGSWASSERGVRLAFRYGDFPDARKDFVGFRLALSPEDSDAQPKVKTGKTK